VAGEMVVKLEPKSACPFSCCGVSLFYFYDDYILPGKA
jgi:hypothetical protein